MGLLGQVIILKCKYSYNVGHVPRNTAGGKRVQSTFSQSLANTLLELSPGKKNNTNINLLVLVTSLAPVCTIMARQFKKFLVAILNFENYWDIEEWFSYCSSIFDFNIWNIGHGLQWFANQLERSDWSHFYLVRSTVISSV